jgi:superfamily II DNA/RNA helicase
MSRHAEATVHSSPPFISPSTFESAGIRAPIASALRLAFPDVKHPTRAQTEFIPAILSGEDMLLKDATGTGK